MNNVVNLEELSNNYTSRKRRSEHFVSMAATVYPLSCIDLLHVGLRNTPSMVPTASSLKGKLRGRGIVGAVTRV